MLRLTANTRLTVSCRPKDVNEARVFADWIMKLEDGKLGDSNDGEIEIDIPYVILTKDLKDPVASTIDFALSNMLVNI